MMRSGNPALNDDIFRSSSATWTDSDAQVMTINGVVMKTGLLLVVLSATAVFTWQQYTVGASVGPYMIGGLIGGLILAMITIFKPTTAPWTSPLYAACEGLALGGISATYEAAYGNGIVIQAVGLTFGTLGALLLTYIARAWSNPARTSSWGSWRPPAVFAWSTWPHSCSASSASRFR